MRILRFSQAKPFAALYTLPARLMRRAASVKKQHRISHSSRCHKGIRCPNYTIVVPEQRFSGQHGRVALQAALLRLLAGV